LKIPLVRNRPCQKSIIGCAGSIVISCITFWNGIGDEIGLLWCFGFWWRNPKHKTLFNIMEMARVSMTDVDNADQVVNFFVIVSQWLATLSG
jgi:hypothetical protein